MNFNDFEVHWMEFFSMKAFKISIWAWRIHWKETYHILPQAFLTSWGWAFHKCSSKLSMLKIIFKRGVCHTVALPFILESILRQKKNYKNSNISPCKNMIFKKKSSKRNQNPSRYYNSIITNLKFQHKPKYIIFQKSLYKNRPIIIYLVGAYKNPLSYYTL